MVRLADLYDGHDDVPSRSSEPGRLFLWFPVGLALQKVRRYLRRLDRAVATTPTGALAVDAPEGYPEELLLELCDLLTHDEGADTRCLFKIGHDDLDVLDIRRVRTVHELREIQRSEWFIDILRRDRLTSVFQPIVHASDTTRVIGHEAFLRGISSDGRTMAAGPLLDAARGCGMLPELDRASHRSAIRAALTHDEKRPLFLNFTAEAIREGVTALRPTIDAMEAAEIPRERVVFEVIEAERSADLRDLRSVVDSVRTAGFRVALDDIGCEEHSRRLVHEVRPDYIKLDMERVRRSAAPHLGGAEQLMDLAQSLRIETIAEGVETSEELEWNRERGATYVQGYFIARPSAVPA